MKINSSCRENNSEVIIICSYTAMPSYKFKAQNLFLFYAHKPMQRCNLSSQFVLFASS